MSIEWFELDPAASSGDGSLPQRYRQPSRFTAAGQQDRRNEDEHVVRMRELQRQAIEATAGQAKLLAENLAYLERVRRENIEAKFKLDQMHKLSQLVAGGDPEMEAKFAILDDDAFRKVRLRLGVDPWQR